MLRRRGRKRRRKNTRTRSQRRKPRAKPLKEVQSQRAKLKKSKKWMRRLKSNGRYWGFPLTWKMRNSVRSVKRWVM